LGYVRDYHKYVKEIAEHNTQEEDLGMREKVERKKIREEEQQVSHTLVARLFELL